MFRFGIADQHINYKGRVGVKRVKAINHSNVVKKLTVECWEMFLVNDANPSCITLINSEVASQSLNSA